MINKIVSIFLILTIIVNTSFAEPFVTYSESKESGESILNFNAEIIAENFNGLKFDLAYFPLDDLPANLPKSFQLTGQGLFCLNVNEYDSMIAIVKTNKFNLDKVVKTERKLCKEKKDSIRLGCKEREYKLLQKIAEVQKKLTDKEGDYKSLESKMIWIQAGAGAAVLLISGFAIYSSQK